MSTPAGAQPATARRSAEPHAAETSAFPAEADAEAAREPGPWGMRAAMACGAAVGLLLLWLNYSQDILVRISGWPAVLGLLGAAVVVLAMCLIAGAFTAWLLYRHSRSFATWGVRQGGLLASGALGAGRQQGGLAAELLGGQFTRWAEPRWRRREVDRRADAGTGVQGLPGDATHVLAWFPGGEDSATGEGFWYLVEIDSWTAWCGAGHDGMPLGPVATFEVPRNTAVSDLVPPVAYELGRPVRLTRAQEHLQGRRQLISWRWRWHITPAYYVSPAEQPDPDTEGDVGDDEAAVVLGGREVPDGATHVLVWVPPWLEADGAGLGWWQLLTREVYLSGERSPSRDGLHEAEDITELRLAQWVARKLQLEVRLSRGFLNIKVEGGRLPRWLRRSQTVPVFYITPVRQEEAAQEPPPDPAPAPADADDETNGDNEMTTRTDDQRRIPRPSRIGGQLVPPCWREVLADLDDFTPATDLELHEKLRQIAAGLHDYGQAIQDLYMRCTAADVRVGRAGMATVHVAAEAVTESAEAVAGGSRALEQYYQGVSDEVAGGVELPRDGDFVTGEGAGD